jgi:hypothetical protein
VHCDEQWRDVVEYSDDQAGHGIAYECCFGWFGDGDERVAVHDQLRGV